MRDPIVLFDGVKALNVNSLPDEAWSYVLGHPLGESATSPLSMYQAVPWVYRAVEMRATALSDLPWAILKGTTEALTSDDWKSVQGLEWTRSLRGLLLRTEQARCVYGKSYWHRIGNVLGTKTLEYRWLLPTSVRPVFDESAGLVGWKRQLQNRELDLALEDVIYSWLPSLAAELGPGLSPVQVALSSAGILANVDKFAEAFFKRGALDVVILSVPPGTPDKEIARLENWWKRIVRGVKGAFETVGLRSTITPTVLSSKPKDLAMGEIVAQQQKDISVAMGVPYSLLFSEATNMATAQQDDLNFYSKCLLPEANQIESDLNEQIFEPLGLTFRFQPSKLEIFEERESAKAFALVAMVSAGVMSPNELREKMDLEPKEGGDELRAQVAPPKFGSNQESQGQVQQDNVPNGNTGRNQRTVDLERWERKALKALKAGKGADVLFLSDALTLDERAEIDAALRRATTAEEVRAAFSSPFRPSPDRWPGDDESYP